jgi:hypothetical protein
LLPHKPILVEVPKVKIPRLHQRHAAPDQDLQSPGQGPEPGYCGGYDGLCLFDAVPAQHTPIAEEAGDDKDAGQDAPDRPQPAHDKEAVMEVTTWYLEPVAGISERRLHKELAKLREGNNVQWGITEVIERMYAVCELVTCVDLGAVKTEGSDDLETD